MASEVILKVDIWFICFMNRIASFKLFFILIFSGTVNAQSDDVLLAAYRNAGFGNPIDTPFALAGTFGEIRNDHFHT